MVPAGTTVPGDLRFDIRLHATVGLQHRLVLARGDDPAGTPREWREPIPPPPLG
jgi:hypothetical protein